MALSVFIVAYLALTMLIGMLSGRLVKTSRDFMLAGRKLSIILCTPTMFSTWFGSETIMGASSEFLEHGLLGVIEDPFGTSLCFLLIGLFIARPIYRLNFVTIVDFYRFKYGSRVEYLSSVFMILSYIGWIAAQFLAMAIILDVVLGVPVVLGVMLSAFIVCVYTAFGGMWSVSINDFIQTTLIVFGLIFLSVYLFLEIGDLDRITQSVQSDFFRWTPKSNWSSWCTYITALLTIGLGSIPQQDVFQRVISAKSENTAVISSFLSAIMYLTIGLLPLFLALAFKVLDPVLDGVPSDQLLLQGVMLHENLAIKVLFIGALLSAIMSSASGAILAPATIIEENMLSSMTRTIADAKRLLILRVSVLVVAFVSSLYALMSNNVYYLVAESSIISLVSLAAPLIAGIYWSKAKPTGALLSILLGPLVWWLAKFSGFETESALLGLFSSCLAMYFGSLLSTHEAMGVTD